jgi:hypothetical protein
MNGWYGLTWDCTEPSTSVNFMDLTISIVNSRLETTLYEKPQNLYLYIPPHSSHPKGVYTGLVFGQVLRIRRLCSHKKDADLKIKQFFDRLTARGHPKDTLLPLFQRAEANAASYLNRTPEEHVELRVKNYWTHKSKSFSTFNFTPMTPRPKISRNSGESKLHSLMVITL